MTMNLENFSVLFEKMLASSRYKLEDKIEYLKTEKYIVELFINHINDEDNEDNSFHKKITLGKIGGIYITFEEIVQWWPKDEEEDSEEEEDSYHNYMISIDLNICLFKDYKTGHILNYRTTLFEYKNLLRKTQKLDIYDYEIFIEKIKKNIEHIYKGLVKLQKIKKCETEKCRSVIPILEKYCFDCICQIDMTEDCVCLDCDCEKSLVKLPCCSKVLHIECFEKLENKDITELNSKDKEKFVKSKFVWYSKDKFKVCPYCREFLHYDYDMDSIFGKYNKYDNIKFI